VTARRNFDGFCPNPHPEFPQTFCVHILCRFLFVMINFVKKPDALFSLLGIYIQQNAFWTKTGSFCLDTILNKTSPCKIKVCRHLLLLENGLF